MGRPPLPIGTWGKIRRDQLGTNRWRARTHFRNYDGETRVVEAHDITGAKAENKLREMLRDRATPNSSDITANTLINTLAELWFDETPARKNSRPKPSTGTDPAFNRPSASRSASSASARPPSAGSTSFSRLAKAHRAQAHNAKQNPG
jgi:hypothetical protein